jgi:hypothetical protein
VVLVMTLCIFGSVCLFVGNVKSRQPR